MHFLQELVRLTNECTDIKTKKKLLKMINYFKYLTLIVDKNANKEEIEKKMFNKFKKAIVKSSVILNNKKQDVYEIIVVKKRKTK